MKASCSSGKLPCLITDGGGSPTATSPPTTTGKSLLTVITIFAAVSDVLVVETLLVLDAFCTPALVADRKASASGLRARSTQSSNDDQLNMCSESLQSSTFGLTLQCDTCANTFKFVFPVNVFTH
jgi:hypothetical protein